MPRILRTRTRHLPSCPARQGSGVVDRRPFSAGFPDGTAGRCLRDTGHRSPAASYSEIGKRRQGPDATPFRPGQPGPLPPHATPPTYPPGRAERPRGGNGQQGPGCGSANCRRGPFVPPVRSPQIQGIGLSPLRGTHGPRRQAGQYAGRRPPRDPRRPFLTREQARCSGNSRPCWIARSRNSASGTSAGPSSGRDVRVAADTLRLGQW